MYISSPKYNSSGFLLTGLVSHFVKTTYNFHENSLAEQTICPIIIGYALPLPRRPDYIDVLNLNFKFLI